MMSKAELARKAGLSTLTIDRVEAGKTCRLDTKRKILHALGLRVSDKDSVFGDRSVDASARNTQQRRPLGRELRRDRRCSPSGRKRSSDSISAPAR